jgi:integrase
MAGIWKRGNYWRAYIRRQGYPQQNRSFDTRAEAEAWGRNIECEMDRGIFVDRIEAELNSFGDLLKRYAEEVSPHKKGGAGEILRIRKLRTESLAEYKVAALTSKVMAEYRDGRLRLVSGSTVNRELTLISHVLTIARKEWGIPIKANPVSDIRRPKENRARTRRLFNDEENRLLSELAPSRRDENRRFEPGGCRNKWVLPVVVLAIETAMRRSEILSLHWPDVFLDERFVRLHDSKNGEPRDVPLSTRAAAILAALPRKPDGQVFPITGEASRRHSPAPASVPGLQTCISTICDTKRRRE